MSISMQQFLATATRKAASDLCEAYLALPEDRRNWKPGGSARTAVDMVSECALNNGYTAEMIRTGQFTASDPGQYAAEKLKVAGAGWDAQKTLLDQNTEVVINVILNTSDNRLTEVISLPWGDSPITEILAYPYWNMAYHLGQINAIGMMVEKAE